jgi:hypothetical protein
MADAGMGGKSTADKPGGSAVKRSMDEKGNAERTKKVPEVTSSAGLAKHNSTPKRGPGEF